MPPRGYTARIVIAACLGSAALHGQATITGRVVDENGAAVEQRVLDVVRAVTHVGPASVMAHTYDSGGDYLNISNFAGSFAVSLYSHGEHKTRVAASSCQ